MSRTEYSVSDIEAMLRGGTFRPSENLQIRLQAAFTRPAVIPLFHRSAMVAAIAVALIALVFVGVVVALSTKEKAAKVIYGVGAVYEAGLVHPINETQQIGDIAITIDWAYADWNQILVGYTTEGKANENERIEVNTVSAVLPNGDAVEGGPTAGYSEESVDSSVAAFKTPQELRELDTVNVQLVLRGQYVQYRTLFEVPADQAAPIETIIRGGEDFSFNLSIPMTRGRIIEVGKMVEARGYQVSLEQLVIAPSMTTAGLCFEVPNPIHYHDWIPIATLKTGINSYSGAGGQYQIGETHSCQRIEIGESVPLDRNRYIFRVDELVGFTYHGGEIVTTDMPPDKQWQIKGPWVFVLED